MIDVSNVSFAYPIPKRYREHLLRPLAPRRRVPALRQVSLHVGAGERLAVVGKNGAGKTTLLKLIGGLLYPNTGTVSIDGSRTQTQGRSLRRRIGYVINEERSFYWRLTGRQNLQFFGALNNLRGEVIQERVTRLLTDVGLKEPADKLVSNYSAGMRQRLALARGLLLDPDILLLDEPTKSLDPVGAEVIRKLILGATKRENRVLIMTTNQLDDMIALCDRICVIRDQHIVADRATPGHYNELRAMVHAFLGEARPDENEG